MTPASKSEQNGWNSADGFQVGQIVTGNVKQYAQYRSLVEVEDRRNRVVLGSIPEEEYQWADETVAGPEELLRVGTKLELKVLSYGQAGRSCKLILSRRLAQTKDGRPRDPWIGIHDKYTAGSLVRATVKGIVGTRAFCEIEEAVKGWFSLKPVADFLNRHMGHKFGSTEVFHPYSVDHLVCIGDEVVGIIVHVDQMNRLITLCIERYLESLVDAVGVEGNVTEVAEIMPAGASFIQERFDGLAIRNVFLADDDKTFCGDIASFLAQAGVKVSAVSNRKEIDMFLRTESLSEVDLFIVALQLSDDGEAGLEVCREIRGIHPSANIVLCTSRDSDNLDGVTEELGICDVLQKPFTSPDLMEFLSRIHGAGRRSEHMAEGASTSSLADRLSIELASLARDTSADAAALFSYDPLSETVQLIASNNRKLQQNFARVRRHLHKSPIRDMLLSGETFDTDGKTAEQAPGKFHYFKRLFPFHRTIGRVVRVPSELGYCLFLFFGPSAHIGEYVSLRADTATAVLYAALIEYFYTCWAKDRQSLYLKGRLLSEYWHELATKTDALAYYIEQISKIIRHSEQPSDWSHLGDVSDDLLRLSKEMSVLMNRLCERPHSNEIDLRDVLSETIEFASFTATRMRIVVSLAQCRDLPKVVDGNIDLKQVFLNVLVNAMQQIDDFIRGWGNIQVSLEYRNSEALPVKVRFRDTGPGIHQKDVEKIFEPLYGTRKGGHGMGLAIARDLMEKLGGRIFVEESIMFVGSTITCELPAKAIPLK